MTFQCFWAGLICLVITAPLAVASPSSNRPVLVELFESEGCSDCPPADELLAKLLRTQPVAGAHIIGLEEHVNYFDNPAHWVDRFSSSQVTDRQYSYAARFNDNSVYTPEMVVDGNDHFVGSDENSALTAIKYAESTSSATVSVESNATSESNYALTVNVNHVPTDLTDKKIAVVVAITEDGLSTQVTGGENRGKVLPHVDVVRDLLFLGFVGSTVNNRFQTTVAISPKWAGHPLHAVAFLQDTVSKNVYGVGDTSL